MCARAEEKPSRTILVLTYIRLLFVLARKDMGEQVHA
jgi:hypothetical protein